MSGLREPARQLIGALSGHGGATQSPEPSTAHGAVGEAGLVGQGCPAAGMGAARRSVHEAAHEGLRLQRTVLSNLLAKVRILAALGLSAPKRAEGRGLGTAENSAAGLVLAYLADHRHESGDRRRVFPMTARALTLELMAATRMLGRTPPPAHRPPGFAATAAAADPLVRRCFDAIRLPVTDHLFLLSHAGVEHPPKEANRQPDPAQEQDRQRPLPGTRWRSREQPLDGFQRADRGVDLVPLRPEARERALEALGGSLYTCGSATPAPPRGQPFRLLDLVRLIARAVLRRSMRDARLVTFAVAADFPRHRRSFL